MSEEPLSAERLGAIKASIRGLLAQSDVCDAVRDLVDAYVAEHEGETIDGGSQEAILKMLRERGVLDQLLTQLRAGAPRRGLPAQRAASGGFYLHVRLLKGRAFVDSLQSASRSSSEAYMMFVAVQFGAQRVQSALQPLAVDPHFDDDFLLRLDPAPSGAAPTSDLLSVATPLHLAAFREDVHENVAVLLGENMLDWRKVLRTGHLGLTVELCGRHPGVPAGIVELVLQVLPGSPTAASGIAAPTYSAETIADRLEQQRVAITVADREFLVYARRWWAEYQAMRPSHKERRVKLFATTSNGRMVPLSHFVAPLQVCHGLYSPAQAARFVSLLRADVTGAEGDVDGLHVGGDASATRWLPSFIFLSQRQGHACNHATLLCSLLLGFGLDAYCALGAAAGDGHTTCVCVITRSTDKRYVVWQPTTGRRWASGDVGAECPVGSVDCVFNHKNFYANVQRSTRLDASMSLDFDNEEHWKAVSALKLRSVPKYPLAALQCDEAGGAGQAGVALEMRLRARIASYRDGLGLLTRFDDSLSYTLAQALYQLEQRQGQHGEDKATTEDDESSVLFEQSVKGVLGAGKTFKAVPLNATTLDDFCIMQLLQASLAGKEVLECVAEKVRFGVRVCVFAFPERVVSVWAMLAVAYSREAQEDS